MNNKSNTDTTVQEVSKILTSLYLRGVRDGVLAFVGGIAAGYAVDKYVIPFVKKKIEESKTKEGLENEGV